MWVERVGNFPDFYVAPDSGVACIREACPNRFAFRSLVARFCRERPSSIAQGWEAALLDPIARFPGMSASGPGHQDQEAAMSGSLEGFVTDDSRVIARPSSYHRVNGLD